MSRWVARIALAVCVLSLDAKPRIRVAGVSVSAGYLHRSGFAPYYPLYGYPFLGDALFYGPLLYPGFYNGFAYGPNMGEVRLRTTAKSGAVYLDGAYAGDLAKLKHIWLDPGAYNLSVETAGHTTFEKRIYVLSGKRLDLQPKELQK